MDSDKLVKEAVRLGMEKVHAESCLREKNADGKNHLEAFVEGLVEGRDKGIGNKDR